MSIEMRCPLGVSLTTRCLVTTSTHYYTVDFILDPAGVEKRLGIIIDRQEHV